MPKVQIIQPKPQVITEAPSRPKLRVCSYCRISSTHSEQETSFEAQKTYFTNYISNNPDWELVEIYADEESGTQAYNRENFMRMIKDCEAHKIDLILTKSISRWARNTLDSLKYIRLTKSLGIPIIFTKEGINTMDHGGELLVTIMSSIAQQESASISKNVQIGVRYHYAEGKVCSGVYRLLGYDRTPEGSLAIVPGEADIVRRIFRDYLDGYSAKHIAQRLIAEGVDGSKTTATGLTFNRHWNFEGIYDILSNEKYGGTLLLQKYYTVDFLTKKVAPNQGQVPQYLVENNHDPIVPVEIYNQVQEEIKRRKKNPTGFKYLHNSSLSGRAKCADCGTSLRRVKSKDGGKTYTYWRCGTKVKGRKYPDADCAFKGIKEDDLKAAVVQAFNLLPEKRDELIRLGEQVRWLGLKPADEMIAGFSVSAASPDEQGKGNDGEQSMEEQAIRMRRAEYADKLVHIRNLIDRIDDMVGPRPVAPEERTVVDLKDFMENGENPACPDVEDFFRRTRRSYPRGPMKEYVDDDVIRFVERILVGNDTITVEFKAGVSVEVENPRAKAKAYSSRIA